MKKVINNTQFFIYHGLYKWDTTQGDKNAHGMPHGSGTVLFASGDQLSGEFRWFITETIRDEARTVSLWGGGLLDSDKDPFIPSRIRSLPEETNSLESSGDCVVFSFKKLRVDSVHIYNLVEWLGVKNISTNMVKKSRKTDSEPNLKINF